MSLQSAEYLKKLADITEAEDQLAKLNLKLDEISADSALMVGGFLPPPAGTAADIVSLGKSLGTGDWGGAFWDAVGIIPIVGDGAKAAAKGGKIANKLADVKKALAKANEAIQKKKDELAEMCKKNRATKKDEVTKATKGCDTAGCGKGSDKDKKQKKIKLVKEKINDLKLQGHGPQRHEGDVTEQQLKDRVMHGKDPMTGTTTDAVTGETHKYSKNATKIKSEEDYVNGESHLRNSDEFKTKVKDAETSGQGRILVENQKLEEIYGSNYKDKVSGQTRIGSKNNPTGVTPTDFDNGSMVGVYTKSNKTRQWELTTMYPEPKN
ncbi:MAG: hypothetical protein WC782_06150 [Methylococcaceae bacterium]|jgi:hypothetical protein